jgi:hypothetical protein
MASPNQILIDITRAIEREINAFNKTVPAIERQVYQKIIELTKDLEVKNGVIANSTKNLLQIGKLKKEIEKLLLNKSYLKSAKTFLVAFDVVEQLQQSYFSELAVKITPKVLLKSIKTDAVKYTAEQLTSQGVNQKVMPGIEQILNTNIRQGGSVADMVEQFRIHLTTHKDAQGNTVHGALQRHAKQITTDSLNQYSANYNEAITSDQGWKWRMYTGSLLETSREWCIHMVAKKYVHESELNTVINDNIDGVKICSDKIPCTKSTGLPQGMIKGTDASNIAQRRGGWQCGHQFGGVPDAFVPKQLRDKFKS